LTWLQNIASCLQKTEKTEKAGTLVPAFFVLFDTQYDKYNRIEPEHYDTHEAINFEFFTLTKHYKLLNYMGIRINIKLRNHLTS
jgi:hypothetical protein